MWTCQEAPDMKITFFPLNILGNYINVNEKSHDLERQNNHLTF